MRRTTLVAALLLIAPAASAQTTPLTNGPSRLWAAGKFKPPPLPHASPRGWSGKNFGRLWRPGVGLVQGALQWHPYCELGGLVW